MQNLVIHKNNQPITTSRLVAGKFSKEHRRVLQDIRTLDCSEKFRVHHFVQGTYTHPKNKQEYPEYIITRDGFTFLAMGFTGKEAAKFKEEYIEAFNEMERQLKEQELYKHTELNHSNARMDAIEQQMETLIKVQSGFHKGMSILAEGMIALDKNMKLAQKNMDGLIRNQEKGNSIFLAQQDRIEKAEHSLGEIDVRAYVHVQKDIKRAGAFIDAIQHLTYMTIAEYAKSHDHNIDRAAASQIGIKAAQMCRELGIEIKKKSHDVFESINAYPRWIIIKIEGLHPELFPPF
jgi:Rha family phage regulatory protein